MSGLDATPAAASGLRRVLRFALPLVGSALAMMAVIGGTAQVARGTPVDPLGLAPVIVYGVGIGLGFVVVSALIAVGIATRTKLACALGLIAGVWIGPHLAGEMGHAHNRKTDGQYLQYVELRDFMALVRRREPAAIAEALRTLQHHTMAHVVCTVAQAAPLSRGRAYGESESVAFEQLDTAELMLVADALATAPAPIEQKHNALYTVLVTLAGREPSTAFAPWLALWKKAHPGEPVQLRMAEVRQTTDSCRAGSTGRLAETPLRAWNDAAIVAWLDSGVGFAPEQQRTVLDAVEGPAVLKRVLDAGVDPNATEPGHERWPLLASRARSLGWRLYNEPDPGPVVELVETLVARGTDVHTPTPEGDVMRPPQTACQIFQDMAKCPCEDEAPARREARLAALQKIQAAVCKAKSVS